MLENLGSNLKLMRIQSRLSRKQVAELVGVSASVIGLYESGERLPSLPVLVKLASQYKTSVDYLLELKTAPPKTLDLEGLTEAQTEALKLTADCFRNIT